MAQQLLTQVPETMRRGELIKIKHSNPTLHALVIQAMDEMRQQMASQGQAMMMQQQKQGSSELNSEFGPMKNLPSPIRVGLMIADQLTEYGKDDLRKMAMDIKHERPMAKEAFHYVFKHMMGWED
jgi:hypothetical protein